MDEEKKKILVVLTIIAGLVGLFGGILYLKEYKFGQNFYELNVSFNNIGTLMVGDPVRVSGVRVGRVKDIELRYKDVLVLLQVDEKYPVPEDSKIIIQSMGIMGERMVTIVLGSMDENMKQSDIYTGVYETGIGEALGSVGYLVAKVDTLLMEVRSVMDSTVKKESFAQQFNTSLENLSVISQDIRELLDNNKHTITTTINKASSTFDDVQTLVKNLDNTVDRIDPLIENVDTLSQDAIELIADIKDFTKRAKIIVDRIESGEGSIGKFINEDEFYDELINTLSAVDSLSNILLDQGIKIRVFRWQK